MADSSVKVEHNNESVAAQVTGKPRDESKEVTVKETHVTTDVVITDPNSDLAVQVPDLDELDLPIHALAQGKTPEEQLSSGGKSEAKRPAASEKDK